MLNKSRSIAVFELNKPFFLIQALTKTPKYDRLISCVPYPFEQSKGRVGNLNSQF